ncbi:F-box protein At3g07870-like isoform X1 [Papaver somniferum]|uniref:F-box protein At3g07870-like isoform X1 n=1 Tax=Papaver somniferum TaxID=3469 RepID=UPI000E703076|nr:F-box protein At3g07870-like isoform X1 [Papaver somniferum]
MENLPEDITLNILSRLPAESVLECKLVSPNWLRILHCNATYFAVKHLHHQLRQLADYKAKHGGADKLDSGCGILYAMRYDRRLLKAKLCFGNYGQRMSHEDLSHLHCQNMHSPLDQYGVSKLKTINHDPFRTWENQLIVGSCNGLVCVNLMSRHGFEDPIYVCNPLTREYIYLDKFNQDCKFQDSMFIGFGYLSQTDEYKVVRIFKGQDLMAQVQVYTLGDGIGWRDKGELDMLLQSEPGIFVNGSLYWFECLEQEIVAFDLVSEVFQVIQSPTCLDSTLNSYTCLCLLGGCLCLAYQDPYGPLELWLYREEKDSGRGTNDKKHCFWSKEYMIASETKGLYTPVALTERGEILLWTGKMLCCYDPKTACLVELASCSDMSKSFRKGQTVLHMNSFVSLKALGEKFAKISRRQCDQLLESSTSK